MQTGSKQLINGNLPGSKQLINGFDSYQPYMAYIHIRLIYMAYIMAYIYGLYSYQPYMAYYDKDATA